MIVQKIQCMHTQGNETIILISDGHPIVECNPTITNNATASPPYASYASRFLTMYMTHQDNIVGASSSMQWHNNWTNCLIIRVYTLHSLCRSTTGQKCGCLFCESNRKYKYALFIHCIRLDVLPQWCDINLFIFGFFWVFWVFWVFHWVFLLGFFFGDRKYQYALFIHYIRLDVLLQCDRYPCIHTNINPVPPSCTPLVLNNINWYWLIPHSLTRG